jgi:uncharacterized cupredoxin-like copper-binding protein
MIMASNVRAACMFAAIAVLTFGTSRALAAEPTTVKVVLSEYKFVPDRIAFQHGIRYRLHLENAGAELHEFTAAAFFKSATIENPEVLNADHTDLVLQPHESKDIILVPRRKGSYSLVCADHDWEGMVGKITVK